jgi:hypothetical protein
MIIHTVRQPFMCRVGQFEEGKQSLCVGLDYKAIKSTKTFWCYIGNNKKVHYEIDSVEALRIGQSWTNPKGRTVIIVPLSCFKKINCKWDKEAYEKKEHDRAVKMAEKKIYGKQSAFL